MNKQIRSRYHFLSDLILLAVAAYLSYVLRLESLDLIGYWSGFACFAALVLIIVPLTFQSTGIYSRHWRYASVEELLLLFGSVAVAAVVAGAVGLGVARLMPGLPDDFVIPRSVPLIFMLLAVPATAGPRFAIRVAARYERSFQPSGSLPVLVVGAGDAGAIIVREMQLNPQLGMKVVGFVDDDLSKHDVLIHGVPVLGNRHDIPRLVRAYNVQQVVIAVPKAPGKAIREIAEICEETGIQAKIMPGIYELLDGTVSVSQLRTVQIEDLLRREPVETDSTEITNMLAGSRVLVTGAGGSIGSELCRQILRCQPAELVMLGHGENPMFDVGNELAMAVAQQQDGVGRGESPHSPPRIHATIADVRFPDRIRHIFEEHRPQVVFHAAAHKHVPLMELNPTEAITNNVFGTRNLLDVSLEMGVEHFVLISTDKAVNPTSIMGASKRAAELLVHQAAKASDRPYVAVRFGNVLGSRGSVVPIFKEQIAKGGPVTVTHPEMVRYFMTIPEAVQLVLQSAALGQGGEVFLLDMGQPVKIVDLARDLIRLSGLEEGRDIDIIFTSTRPGEKLFEELFVPGEAYERTRHQKIFIAGNASSIAPTRLNEQVDALEVAAQQDDRAGIIGILQDLIPEYQPGADSGGEAPTPNSPTAPSVQSAQENVRDG